MNKQIISKKIGFIGTGKMASALIASIVKSKLVEPKDIIACDKKEEALIGIKSSYSINIHCDNKEIVKLSEIIFLCVKPQDMDYVLKEIKDASKNKLFVSIAAGITLEALERYLKRVIRVMPNLACTVGASATVYCPGKDVSKSDEEIVRRILDAAGMTFKVNDEQINAIASLTASGIAYFAFFIKELAQSIIDKGVDADIAYKLASQTSLGAGKLLLEKNISPKELIDMVSSPGGMTVEAMKILDTIDTKKILKKTIENAYNRANELSK